MRYAESSWASGVAEVGTGKRPLRLPEWLRHKHPLSVLSPMKAMLRGHRLNTVCEEARCPNKSECFSRPTATLLIMGPVCTRNCSFCSVESGRNSHKTLLPPDPDEPRRVAEAASEMGLRYVVVTSVTRDDLPDGGASMFAATIRALRDAINGVGVEVLVPDFRGDTESLRTVLKASPDVLNHNMETVPTLYAKVRPQADYLRSLKLLRASKDIAPEVRTKSGLMMGLGESYDEVVEVMRDLRSAGTDFLTIGQYMRPSLSNIPVREYIHPSIFDKLHSTALEMGFSYVASAPLARSSMRADEFILQERSGESNVRV